MKNYIKNNFASIILVITLLTLFKSCSDSRTIGKMEKEIRQIKDSLVTKEELSKELKITGLESEKRMIQATDRKMLDVSRQTQIDEELKKLENE